VEVRPDGSLLTLAERYQGKRFNSPNDIVLGPDGALYFTDPTLDLPKGQKQEIPLQGIYRLSHNGALELCGLV
jgi:gluconolactonase